MVCIIHTGTSNGLYHMLVYCRDMMLYHSELTGERNEFEQDTILDIGLLFQTHKSNQWYKLIPFNLCSVGLQCTVNVTN